MSRRVLHVRRFRRFGLVLAAGLLAGCLEDPALDDQLFPCREAGDCIEGFVCAPERFVCVPEGEPGPVDGVDAGTMDAGG